MTTPEFTLTEHARDVLSERGISEDWIGAALASPDSTAVGDDGNRHYVKRIRERGGRYLRVICDRDAVPHRVITAFFDRRLRRQK